MKIGLMLTSSCNFQCRHCMVDSIRQESIADRSVIEDQMITHELLTKREKSLREYLLSVNMLHDSMLFMCNEVCNRFKVTKNGIFRDGELMKNFDMNRL